MLRLSENVEVPVSVSDPDPGKMLPVHDTPY